MKRIFEPKEVLLAVITYYANTECENFNASASAKFVEDEAGVTDGTIELTIDEEESEEPPKKPRLKILN